MTAGEALAAAAARLRAAGVADPARDARLLLAHAARIEAARITLIAPEDLAPEIEERFDQLISLRAIRVPVSHLVGERAFYGRRFKVSGDVLDPRPETETLIEAALAIRPDARRVLDCGTGTGALLLTVLAEGEAEGVGVDASKAALLVAQENAQALGVAERAHLLRRDWTQAGWADDLGTFDLILANPPYVEEGAPLDPSVRDHEPHSALFSGPEGLDDYRILLPQIDALLEDGGAAVFEIGTRQADAVTALAEAEGYSATLRRDLAGRARALVMTRGLNR